MIKPTQWQQIEPFYHAALERTPDARAASFIETPRAGLLRELNRMAV